jgi:hypothetical protein
MSELNDHYHEASAAFGDALTELLAAARSWTRAIEALAAASSEALKEQHVEIDLLRAQLRAHQRRQGSIMADKEVSTQQNPANN